MQRGANAFFLLILSADYFMGSKCQKLASHVSSFAKFMLLSAADFSPFLPLGFSPPLKLAVPAQSGRDCSLKGLQQQCLYPAAPAKSVR